jgi:hypothetical protein
MQGGQLVDMSQVKEGDLSTNAYRASYDFNRQLQNFIRNIPKPVLEGSSPQARNKYREDMVKYNNYVKSREREFMDIYKDEILGNVEQRFLEAGYTKDKNGMWTKPASIKDLPWLAKATSWIPGAHDFINNAITKGETFYNDPNLENALELGNTAVNAWNVGKATAEKLLNPKKLVKDLAIRQGRKMLGVGLNPHHHYDSWKRRKLNGGGFNEIIQSFDQKFNMIGSKQKDYEMIKELRNTLQEKGNDEKWKERYKDFEDIEITNNITNDELKKLKSKKIYPLNLADSADFKKIKSLKELNEKKKREKEERLIKRKNSLINKFKSEFNKIKEEDENYNLYEAIIEKINKSTKSNHEDYRIIDKKDTTTVNDKKKYLFIRLDTNQFKNYEKLLNLMKERNKVKSDNVQPEQPVQSEQNDVSTMSDKEKRILRQAKRKEFNELNTLIKQKTDEYLAFKTAGKREELNELINQSNILYDELESLGQKLGRKLVPIGETKAKSNLEVVQQQLTAKKERSEFLKKIKPKLKEKLKTEAVSGDDFEYYNITYGILETKFGFKNPENTKDYFKKNDYLNAKFCPYDYVDIVNNKISAIGEAKNYATSPYSIIKTGNNEVSKSEQDGPLQTINGIRIELTKLQGYFENGYEIKFSNNKEKIKQLTAFNKDNGMLKTFDVDISDYILLVKMYEGSKGYETQVIYSCNLLTDLPKDFFTVFNGKATVDDKYSRETSRSRLDKTYCWIPFECFKKVNI